MWEELSRFNNQYLQREITYSLKPSSINKRQAIEFQQRLAKRGHCVQYAKQAGHSTYFDNRAKLAYGWFALPKLMREMDSADNNVHWAAINSLSEFLQNPLHCQRAITQGDIIRKTKNCFMRIRLKYINEEHNEIETLLQIYNTISRYLNGAIKITESKCLIIEFYKIVGESDPRITEIASEILRYLSKKPEVFSMLFADEENKKKLTELFISDPCKPYYPEHLWHHLIHFLEKLPEQAIELGFFEFLHQRLVGRLPLYWDMTMKSFALLLRCVEGQRRFDDIDGVALLRSILVELPNHQNHEYLVLAFMNGLHSKRALWRCREFTRLPDNFGRIMKYTENPRLQMYCLQMFRELGVMLCIKRYIIAHWLQEIGQLKCLSVECECTRDSIIEWLRRDINEMD